MKNKMVSVIVPFYKAGAFAENLVNSLNSQVFTDFEVIFVDDGEGKDIFKLESALSKNIRFQYVILKTKGHEGPGVARNVGLVHSKSPIIAFLDADDYWSSVYLQIGVEKLRADEDTVIAFSTHYVNEYREEINYSVLPSKICYEQMIQTCPVSLPGVIIDRRKVQGKIEFKSGGHEDYHLWLKLLSNGVCFKCVNVKALFVTRVKGSVSSNKFKATKWHIEALSSSYSGNIYKKTILVMVYLVNALLKRKTKVYRPKYLPSFVSKYLLS
jgi:teichuronic acid biosynthesis glycosyltransferase TuaG